MRGLSPVAASGGHSSSRCAGLSPSRPLLLRSTRSRRAGSVAVAHGPSCSAACGIFPDQGSNPRPLHWQADSQPLRHQGSPEFLILINVVFSIRISIIFFKYTVTFYSFQLTAEILNRVFCLFELSTSYLFYKAHLIISTIGISSGLFLKIFCWFLFCCLLSLCVLFSLIIVDILFEKLLVEII